MLKHLVAKATIKLINFNTQIICLKIFIKAKEHCILILFMEKNRACTQKQIEPSIIQNCYLQYIIKIHKHFIFIAFHNMITFG